MASRTWLTRTNGIIYKLKPFFDGHFYMRAWPSDGSFPKLCNSSVSQLCRTHQFSLDDCNSFDETQEKPDPISPCFPLLHFLTEFWSTSWSRPRGSFLTPPREFHLSSIYLMQRAEMLRMIKLNEKFPSTRPPGTEAIGLRGKYVVNQADWHVMMHSMLSIVTLQTQVTGDEYETRKWQNARKTEEANSWGKADRAHSSIDMDKTVYQWTKAVQKKIRSASHSIIRQATVHRLQSASPSFIKVLISNMVNQDGFRVDHYFILAPSNPRIWFCASAQTDRWICISLSTK